MNEQEMFLEQAEGDEVTPTLVIVIDTAWQQFSFSNNELRIKVAPGSWVAMNVPVREQA
jgi:hypothetical protein